MESGLRPYERTVVQAARASDSASHIHGPMAEGGVCSMSHMVVRVKWWEAKGVEGIAKEKQRGGVRGLAAKGAEARERDREPVMASLCAPFGAGHGPALENERIYKMKEYAEP